MDAVRLASLLLGLALLVGACGGSEDSGTPAADVLTVETETSETAEASRPAWVEPYVREEGTEVGLVFSTSDYAVGENRVGFLVVQQSGELVQAPQAKVYVGGDDAAAPVEATAVLEPVGPHTHPDGAKPHDHPEATDLYVASLDLPEPGRYWMIVQPEGEPIQGIGALDVRAESLSPSVGSEAIPSDNPTLAGAPAEEITTARPPDRELLRYSIADSLKHDVPIVVVFATPKFCESRTCGPTVEVVDKARETFANSGIRFIHVEVYEDNDPQKGVNKWVKEWSLPTEPWVFVVDDKGVIQAKFEGSVGVEELEAAIRTHLL